MSNTRDARAEERVSLPVGFGAGCLLTRLRQVGEAGFAENRGVDPCAERVGGIINAGNRDDDHHRGQITGMLPEPITSLLTGREARRRFLQQMEGAQVTTKIVERLRGWRVAAVVCAGLWAPGAALAADQTVAVVSPSTGDAAVVNNGSLHVVDTLAQYRNNPAHWVNINLPSYVADGCDSVSYTVPSGQALIVTSIQGNFYNTDGLAYTGLALYTGESCGGTEILREFVPVAATAGAVAAKSFQLGDGIAVPAGSVLSLYAFSDTGYNFIQGYLVPASLVPHADMQPAFGTRAAGRPGPSSR